ncbi:MAG: hypothetical protein KDK78_03875 [Chlamydiia bacterium]|nr:hypothetical protein [Chlamydiia bacterium]
MLGSISFAQGNFGMDQLKDAMPSKKTMAFGAGALAAGAAIGAAVYAGHLDSLVQSASDFVFSTTTQVPSDAAWGLAGKVGIMTEQHVPGALDSIRSMLANVTLPF